MEITVILTLRKLYLQHTVLHCSGALQCTVVSAVMYQWLLGRLGGNQEDCAPSPRPWPLTHGVVTCTYIEVSVNTTLWSIHDVDKAYLLLN